MTENGPERKNEDRAARRASLEDCMALVENSLTGMAVVQDFRIVYANPTMIRYMGYTMEEAAGKHISEFIHPDDRERVINYYRKRIAGEEAPEQYEFRATSRSGEVRVFDMRPTIIEYSGRPAVMMNVVDITDRSQAEDALKKSQEEYRSLVESIYDWLWEVNEECVYTYASPRVRDVLGLEPKDVLGKKPFDFMPPEEVVQVHEAFDPIWEQRIPFNLLENTLVRADGQRVVVETSGRPVFDDEGRFRGYRGIDRDITARKLAQESLQSSEQRLADIISFLPDATFAIDTKGIIITWNLEMEKLTGLKADEMMGKGDYEYALPFYGERRPMLLDLVLKPHENVEKLYPFINETGGTLVTEVFVPAFGHGAYLWSKASPLYDSKGQIVGAIESVRDITERKQAEESRREFERKVNAQKRQFYRDTILSVTDGKLNIGDGPLAARYLSRAKRIIGISDARDASDARHEAICFLEEHGLSGDRLQAFIMGVGEAIANAVKHASGGRLYLGTEADKVWVGVADKGKGIESLILPKATLQRGFSTKPSLGLGYSIMLDVADQVILRTGGRGTVVILVENLRQPDYSMPANRLPDTWETIPDVDRQSI